MKNPNPIIPPGMNLEKTRRGRSNMRIAVIVIVLVHVVLFGGILFNACSQKEEETTAEQNKENTQVTETTEPPPIPPPDFGGINNIIPTPPGEGNGGPGPLPPPPTTRGGTTGGGTLPPLPGPRPLPTPPSGTREHVIQSGDNFWVLAKKYDVTAQAIQQANPTILPTKLKIGNKLVIPAPQPKPVTPPTPVDGPDIYVVKRGDTLGHIAKRHGTTVKALRRVNNLQSDLILAGQKLKLPPGAKFSTTPTSTRTLPGVPGTN